MLINGCAEWIGVILRGRSKRFSSSTREDGTPFPALSAAHLWRGRLDGTHFLRLRSRGPGTPWHFRRARNRSRRELFRLLSIGCRKSNEHTLFCCGHLERRRAVGFLLRNNFPTGRLE